MRRKHDAKGNDNMKKLHLITDNFPFGKGEKSFIVPELKYLLENFEVTIISTSTVSNITTKLDKEISLFHYKMQVNFLKLLKYFIRLIFNRNMIIEIKEIIKAKDNIFNRIMDSIKFYIKSENFHEYLVREEILTPSTNALFYTYWSDEKLFAICNHRRSYPNIKLITRVHGRDLYNERNDNGRLPFRSCIDKNVDHIFFVSKYGMDYYLKSHKKEPIKKYQLYKLGVKNSFGKAKYFRRDFITLISCSNIIALKRVALIIEALYLINDVNIKWVHFGDGESFDETKALANELLNNKENITYEFKGHVDYLEIHKYYMENIIDCFITTSATEGGTPVSIQEALSYGIPIIGTDVGGISEMIDGNGFLIGGNPQAEEIADSIRKIAYMSDELYKSFRVKSRTIWENQYDADKNFKSFTYYLKDL